MTTTNGWPDPARPGVPLNPEKDGWHWLLANTNKGPQPEAAFWDSRCFAWFCQGIEELTRPEKMMNYGWLGYLGPCLTPDEATALQKRVAELEGALQTAAECIDADDAIGAHNILAAALEKKRKLRWVCPNNTPGCVKNCGNYGCGN